MPSDFILFATVGTHDIQVVGHAGNLRIPIGKHFQRPFHEAWLRHRDCWRFRSLPETLSLKEAEDGHLELNAEGSRLTSKLHGTFDLSSGGELCAPLLADAWMQIQEWKRDPKQNLGDALHVVLFNTNRDPATHPRHRSEPVAAHDMVLLALAEAFGVCPDDRGVTNCFFLTSGDLYETDESGQRHLRMGAASALDEEFRNAREKYRDRHPIAIVADAGGFPEVKSVVAASAAYRFEEKKFVRSREEKQDKRTRAGVIIPPAESLDTRRRVKGLVEGGAFDAAAGLAHTGADGAVGRAEPWRRLLKDVTDVLEGSRLDPEPWKRLVGDGRIIPETHKALGRLQDGGPALLVAFRVEAALWRGNWAVALRETFTFGEVAFVNLVDQQLRCDAKQGCVGWDDDLFYPRKSKLDEQQLGELGLWDEEAGRPCEEMPFSKMWQRDRELKNPPGKRYEALLGQRLNPLALNALESYRAALNKVRGYRNMATHGHLTGDKLREVRLRLQDQKVWSPMGSAFIGSERVRAILEQAGVNDGEALYQGLVEAILTDLDIFSFRRSEDLPCSPTAAPTSPSA